MFKKVHDQKKSHGESAQSGFMAKENVQKVVQKGEKKEDAVDGATAKVRTRGRRIIVAAIARKSVIAEKEPKPDAGAPGMIVPGQQPVSLGFLGRAPFTSGFC
ncbi:MAG: hypothetical protein WC717_01225 [Candidatus Micrarchaeia archaeon]|jgi:hypothetical protein